MDAGTAAILGTITGAIVGWLVSLFARAQDAKTRREEREYSLLITASRELRLSLITASQLDYSKSRRAVIDPTSWGVNWQPFLESVVRAASAIALLSGQIPRDEQHELSRAMQALVDARRSDRSTLSAYLRAATLMRRSIDRRAAQLAGLPPPEVLEPDPV